MLTPLQASKDPSNRLLIAVLAVVMGAFVVASLVAQRTSARIESLSNEIVSISGPSMEHLASMRGVVFEVQLTLSEALRDGAAGEGRLATVEPALKTLNEDVDGYLSLPVLHDEESYWRQIHAALARFDDAVRQTRDMLRASATAAAQQEYARAVEPAGRQLIEGALNAIEFHARSSRSSAAQIRDARRRSVLVGDLLSVICVAFGIVGLLLVIEQAQRQRALARAQSEFHAARADELEQFAGRVAHDIRDPLASAAMALQLAQRHANDDVLRKVVARIERALARADAITTALLDFARSGAQPEPGARTDPRVVLADLVQGTSPEAERLRIEVELEPIPRVLVACSQGVYLSLVSNLVRNAIKYMGQAAPRRVTIRVIDLGARVRTEVVDTGPGIAADHLPSLFDAYFRVGRDRAKEGLGLGLATVKKLAEGHHGQVGVSSELGRGSTFWFELPRAGSPWSAADSAELEVTRIDRPEAQH